MHLFVGLGNPGPSYAGHRHNIGFMLLDAIAEQYHASPWRSRFQGLCTEATIDGERILLLKPQTYMNESGRSVGEAMRFHKLPLEALIVAHDELDLAPGKVRVKVGGGDAGHNGLRSITAHCSAAYVRVRLGIGHPGHKDLVHSHVLSNFSKAEQPWVHALCRAGATSAGLLIKQDHASFQNRISLAMQTLDEASPAKT